MKWAVGWLAAVLVGFAMMLGSYYGLQGPQRAATAQTIEELKAAAKAEGESATLRASAAESTSKLLGADTRTPAGPFELYLAGQAFVLLGGSGLLVLLYALISMRLGSGTLGEPMAETVNWRWLLIGLHVAFFGTMIVVSQITYAIPDIQKQALSQIDAQIRGNHGPLGMAGAAYLSGNIPLAAIVTLAINFLLGTLFFITLPSVIVPGVGVAFVFFRFAIWGLLLAPTYATLGGRMLPHTFTLLVEGEAYVLGSFFAALIPAYFFAPSKGVSLGERYGRAFLVNAKGLVWVFAILAVAAIYEATEVIAQLP